MIPPNNTTESVRTGSELQSSQPIAQVMHPYGVGIDVHSKFIQVCILVQNLGQIDKFEKEFSTDWHKLVEARDWAFSKLPAGTELATMRYCLESTGTYHNPVLLAWKGVPSVVNPLLAGPSRRKTDVLDAQMLAHHSITGVWKPSFIAPSQSQELRVLWAARREHVRAATRAGNRINNILLRFGHSIGATYSIRSEAAQGLVTALIEGEAPANPTIAPTGLPESMRPILAELSDQMLTAVRLARAAVVTARNFILARDWPLVTGHATGTQLLAALRTAPGVGETTAITWLAETCDPRRFQHAKQVAAYCGCDPSLKVSAGKVTSHQRRAGNKRLHAALLYAAAAVMRSTTEPLGNWGRSIAGRHKKGGYRKAWNAVARRLAVSLWHMHCTAADFSYAQYHFNLRPVVKLAPLTDMVPRRFADLLARAGFEDSRQVTAAFLDGKLASISGFGASAMQQVKQWIALNQTAHHPLEQLQEQLAERKPGSKKTYFLEPPKKFVPKKAATNKTKKESNASSTRKDSKVN